MSSSHAAGTVTADRDFTLIDVSNDVDFVATHRANPGRYPFLLESAATGSATGRYDFLFAFPGDALVLDEAGRIQGGEDPKSGFLAELDRVFAGVDRPEKSTALPFIGGWFMLLGYELAQEVEPTLRLPRTDTQPVAVAVRIPVAAIRDRKIQRTFIVAEAGRDKEAAEMCADLESAPRVVTVSPARFVEPLTEEDPQRYLDAVKRAREYIVAGDVFQANLSRLWRGRLAPDVDTTDLYLRLRKTNPAPFAGLARFGDLSVISSSPERLLRVNGKHADTRPIAGTRSRGGGDEDARLSSELIAHPKERAEHIMLIDLERNDLGRVCEPGTVLVDELMVIESYAHVHHIVSNVCGTLRAGVTPGDAIKALFPGGTITGCPKVRCMEIIAELEGAPRGPYTGSMGYLSRDGTLDLNILIRTLVREQDELSFRAGAGIVFDSDPQRELTETREKAAGLTLALAAD